MLSKYFASFSLLALCGCATTRTMGPLPSHESDFVRPISELKASYPEISIYERGSALFGHCTDIKEVITQLGQPEEIRTEWIQVPLIAVPLGLSSGGVGGAVGVAIAYGMYPKQPKNYVWSRGDYKITARAVVDVSCGYNTRIHMINWENIHSQ